MTRLRDYDIHNLVMTNVMDTKQGLSAVDALTSNRDAKTRGKMAYYCADIGDVYPHTRGGYVRARAAAIRAAGITTLAEFRAFRRGWENWALEDSARLGWWWL